MVKLKIDGSFVYKFSHHSMVVWFYYTDLLVLLPSADLRGPTHGSFPRVISRGLSKKHKQGSISSLTHIQVSCIVASVAAGTLTEQILVYHFMNLMTITIMSIIMIMSNNDNTDDMYVESCKVYEKLQKTV